MDEIYEKLPSDFLQKTYKKLIERVNYHVSHAVPEKKTYQRLGYSLNVIIPVMSAFIAYFAGHNSEYSQLALSAISLLLTVFAVINSVVKPAERYAFLAHGLIKLHDWKLDLDLQIFKQLQAENGGAIEDKICDLFVQKNHELSKIGLALANNKLPENNLKTA